jgi:hypothetical protein
MPYSIDLQPEAEMLVVRVSGSVELAPIGPRKHEMDQVVAAFEKGKQKGILFDLRDTKLNITITDMYEAGNALAKGIGRGTKIAALGVPGFINTGGFFGQVVRFWGVDYREFTDETEAKGWMKE